MRDRHLVPASVGPQPVHRVGRFEQREIPVERQPCEIRATSFLVGHVPLAFVVAVARVGPHELSVRKNPLQRQLPVVEYQVVDVTEDAPVAHCPELGRRISASRSDPDAGIMLLEVLRAPQRGEQASRKRNRETDDRRPLGRDFPFEQFAHSFFNRVHRLDQYGLDLGERPDRHGQTFSVTDDLEVFGHRRADQIAQILQVERAEEFGAFRRPEGSEQIAQVSDRLESSRLRQKLARADQLGEARVPSAQEIDDGVDRGRIARPHGLDALQILVFARNPQIENPFEKIPRKHGPDQFDRQVGLSDVEPPAPEVAAQVSGGRVGTVDLNERRRDEQQLFHVIREFRRSGRRMRNRRPPAARPVPPRGVPSGAIRASGR